MSLKRSLFLILTVLFIFSIIASVVIYRTLQVYQKGITQQYVAEQITIKIFQRKIFGDEYIRLNVDRALTQWVSKQKEIRDLVNSNEKLLNEPEQGRMLAAVRKGLDSSEAVIAQADDINRINDEDAETRILNQLAIKSQETLSSVEELAQDAKKTINKTVTSLLWVFSSVLILFFILLITSSWIIWRTAKQIAESNERFNFVMKATSDTIYDWDILSETIIFGDGMQKTFGYTKDQIVESLDWWSSQIDSEDRERVNQQIDSIIQSSQISFILEYRFKRGDGSYANVIDKAYLVRDSSGKAIRYVGVMQDVSSAKEYELELKKRTNEAEKLNRLTVDRELKMIELKKQIAELTKGSKKK